MNCEDIKEALEWGKDFSDVYEIEKSISYLRRLYSVIYTNRKRIEDKVVCQVINEEFGYINKRYKGNFICTSADMYEIEIKNAIDFLNVKAFEICLKRTMENSKDKEE